jgi:predicted CoA-substrate-specific enzyme activase
VREDGSLQVDLKGIYAQCGCDEPEASREKQVVATGYGRHLVQFDNARSVPELVAHAAGAAGQVTESSFVLIDLGGQDSKVILVEDATVRHFVMNDKCAAGSGRYVENMARLLMLDLDDVIHHTRSPVLLTNVCATFGESEVVGMVVEGRPIEQISAGIMASVANRTAALVARLPELKGKPVYLAGGLACSKALVVFLSDLLDVSVHSLPEPTFNGAIGCVCLCGS